MVSTPFPALAAALLAALATPAAAMPSGHGLEVGSADERALRPGELGPGELADPAAFLAAGRGAVVRGSAAALPELLAPAPQRVVIEFVGEELALLGSGQPAEPVVTLSGGRTLALSVQPLADPGRWRLTVEFDPQGQGQIELRAFLRLYSQALTETSTYLWNR